MTHNSYYPMSFPPKENFLDETLLLSIGSLPQGAYDSPVLGSMCIAGADVGNQ